MIAIGDYRLVFALPYLYQLSSSASYLENDESHEFVSISRLTVKVKNMATETA